MAPVNFLRLLTVISLAFLNISFGTRAANALAVERGHMARSVNYAHADIVRKHSKSSKQCKHRPVQSSSLPHNVPSSTPVQTSYSHMHTTTAASSQPSPPSTTDGKVGLAWSNDQQHCVYHFVTKKTTWIYNWALKYNDPGVDLSKLKGMGVEYVPTISRVKDLPDVASTLIRGYAQTVKAFNEPNIVSQANLTPQEAYKHWMDYIEPLANLGYNLIAPSVTSDYQGDHAGLLWLVKFMSLCGKCRVAAIDVHHYSATPGQLETDVNRFRDHFSGMKIWVSEFGCQDYSGKNQPCTPSIFNAFYQSAINYLEKSDFIEMYAMFGLFTPAEIESKNVETINSMIDPNSCVPNALGYRYINA